VTAANEPARSRVDFMYPVATPKEGLAGPMQQFRIFRALGLSFKAWFKNFIPFTLLAAVLYSPVVLWLLTYDPKSAENVEAVQNAYFVRPVYILTGISSLLAPLITYRVIQDLNGIKVSMLTSIRFGLRGIVPAIFVAIITNLLQFVPAGGIVAAIVMCIWFVATPAAVAEQLGTMAALTRSSQLTKGRRWGIFGLTFLIGLLLVGLLLIWIVPQLENMGDTETAVRQLEHSSIMFVVTIGLFHLFSGIVEAVAYVLLREDKDGVSVQELAKIFD